MDISNQTSVTLCHASESEFSALTAEWFRHFSDESVDLSQYIDALYIDFGSEDLPPVDDIRQSLSFVWTKPRMSQYKFLVLHNVQLMNASMANALLKLLEEPPRYLRCLLLTTSRERVLKTIQSRCVFIDCEGTVHQHQWIQMFNLYLQRQMDESVLLKHLMECDDHDECIDQLMVLVHKLALHIYNDDLDEIWQQTCSLSSKVKSKITWNKANLASEYLILLKKIRRFAEAN